MDCVKDIFIEAIKGKNLEVIKFLSKYVLIKNLIKIDNGNGKTLLMYASEHDSDMDIAQILVNNGDDINAIDSEGETPLHYAVKSNNLKMVKYLLDCGADINLIDIRGMTPYTLAIKNKTEEMVALIENFYPNIDIQDSYGKTSLMYAAETMEPEFVKNLVKKGADVNKEDNYKWTPMMYVAKSFSKNFKLNNMQNVKKSKEIARILIDSKARYVDSAIYLCCPYKYFNIFEAGHVAVALLYKKNGSSCENEGNIFSYEPLFIKPDGDYKCMRINSLSKQNLDDLKNLEIDDIENPNNHNTMKGRVKDKYDIDVYCYTGRIHIPIKAPDVIELALKGALMERKARKIEHQIKKYPYNSLNMFGGGNCEFYSEKIIKKAGIHLTNCVIPNEGYKQVKKMGYKEFPTPSL